MTHTTSDGGSIDSEVTADTELFAAAAHDAIALTNVTLGERLARAAVNRDGGLVTSELLARSLLWQGKAAEAEVLLAPNEAATRFSGYCSGSYFEGMAILRPIPSGLGIAVCAFATAAMRARMSGGNGAVFRAVMSI